MAVRNKPYEQFGPYILFKKLEADSLTELWRAAHIDQSSQTSLVALRRFTAGNAAALAASATHAALLVPSLAGTSFVRNQVVSVVAGTALIAHEYAGGRSLRHIVERARGVSGAATSPIPIDQAIAISERIALSLATIAEMRYQGQKLSHGALLPQFVWITDDGEIRVAGQQLGAGLLASMGDARIATEIGRYFSPEARTSGDPSKTSDIYSLGAILFLLVTGSEPPDSTTSSAFTQTIRAAKTMSGGTIPGDVRAIFEKSLALDPAARYPSAGEAKRALSALANQYTATTFNLAFYLSTLLKKEIESETLEREKESKVSLAPYLEQQALSSSEGSTTAVAPEPGQTPSGGRRRAPLAIAATLLLAAAGAGAWYMLRSPESRAPAVPSRTQPAVAPAAIAPPPATKPAVLVSQPLVASLPASAGASPVTVPLDEATRKKAFEDAVQQKMQQEMMKLQADYTRKLQEQQSKHAPLPIASTPAPAAAPKDENVSAAQLDQQSLASRQPTTALPIQQSPAAAAVTQTATPQQTPAPPPPAVPSVREGDVIDVNDVDTVPHVVRSVAPSYPVLAARQKVETTILLTVLISETGHVLDVRILRGDKRFGFEDAAIRALKATLYSPAVKDGKRVKTWFPIPVSFKM